MKEGRNKSKNRAFKYVFTTRENKVKKKEKNPEKIDLFKPFAASHCARSSLFHRNNENFRCRYRAVDFSAISMMSMCVIFARVAAQTKPKIPDSKLARAPRKKQKQKKKKILAISMPPRVFSP